MLVLYLLCMLQSLVSAQIYLYETRPSSSLHSQLKLNCLQYSDLGEWDTAYTIEYCLRPLDIDEHWWKEGEPADDHQRFTFQQLSSLNTTAEDLLQWSTSIELVEDYQHYLNHKDNQSATREFFRCTPPWFGPRCQYSFTLVGGRLTFDIVQRLLKLKMKTKPMHNESYATCYQHLHCRHGEVPICLHWNQICDGRVDCIDGGEDELSCSALEANECENGEYRCHNGLCIPQNFVNDKTAECLDQSDVFIYRYWNYAERLNVREFVWREYGCPSGVKTFICGNGQCVRDFEACRSGRHEMVNTLISVQGTLTKKCWTMMVCLTGIMDHVDGMPCLSLVQSINITASTLSCESLIRFPTKPVLLHHVYFLYHRNDLFEADEARQVLVPAYICYDQHLCEHLRPTFHHYNLSCRSASQMGLHSSVSYQSWLSVIDALRPQFDGCMLFTRNASSSSLYCCRNSSKCISRHRIVDSIIDCPHADDEQAFEVSCSIPDQHRFRCDNERQCRSPLYSANVCPPRRFLDLKDIQFGQICNRIPQTIPQLIDGVMHTDETECEQWRCSNTFTRCDGYWNCVDGEDELNCTSPSSLLDKCPVGTFECVSRVNYTMICLWGGQVADGVMDCVGGADEKAVCHENIHDISFPTFLCYNETKCVPSGALCDKHVDCAFGDDQAFCNGRANVCNNRLNPFPTAVEQSICRFAEARQKYWSFDNLPVMSSLQRTKSSSQTHRSHVASAEDTSIGIRSLTPDTQHPWFCHDGLPALVRLAPHQFTTRCFCPPNFYGDRCQHQNERVTITLKIYSVSQLGVQSFFVSLISEDDQGRQQLQSYHQFSYALESNCGRSFKFFLLYRTRPKNISRRYLIKIDAYDQRTLAYLASWRYSVPFLFLPVNPMAIAIRVPHKPVSSRSLRCPLKCDHGACLTYVNDGEFFCHCESGWTGQRCEQVVDCADCASDSLCVGSLQNRSICMCPINRFGRQCLVAYSCDRDFECENGGQCVIVDPSKSVGGYACLCPKEYYDSICQFQKSVLHLTFDDVAITPYALIYIFYTGTAIYSLENWEVSMIVLAQKLSIFQTSATFYTQYFPHVAFVQFGTKQYLAALLPNATPWGHLSATVSAKHECPHFAQLVTPSLRQAPDIRRVKQYYHICRSHPHLMCFVDDHYFCICTTERHATCLKMQRDFRCPEDLHCLNGAQCLQERPDCPSMTFCICSDCFFGDRCQFYAKGIGLTLDDILRYELRPMTSLTQQSAAVKIGAALAVVIFVVGVINSVLSLMTFHQGEARRVGAGIYLLASSVTSLSTVTIFNLKFWFLIITQIRASVARSPLHSACVANEAILKLSVYTDTWLNACVAIERAITIFQGTNFNRQRSTRIAIWVIAFLPLAIGLSLIHEFLYRDLYDDEEEQRIWCILRYSSSINAYSTFILSFHTITPFLANVVSATLIIVLGARRKAYLQQSKGLWKNLQAQMKEHRHLIISPIILAALSFPRVIISLTSGCVKVNRSPFLYLVGYYISLIPSVAIFLVFVLPSPLYREQFYKSTRAVRQFFVTDGRSNRDRNMIRRS